MTKKYIEVDKDDALKLKAALVLLKRHTTYGNFSWDQTQSTPAVLDFLDKLPERFEKAEAVEAKLDVKGLKEQAKRLGYEVMKKED